MSIPTYPATPEGAASAVRSYYAAAALAAASGDVGAMKAWVLPTCEPCQKAIRFIEETYNSGGRIEGAEISVRAVAPIEASKDAVTLTTQYSLSASRVISSSGEVLAEPAVDLAQDEIVVQRVDDTWLIAQLKGV